jgi:hypothetical protein
VSSSGPEAVELAESAGLILDPWQRFSLEVALGEQADGNWAAFEVAVIVSRQNGKGGILEARALGGLYLFDEELLIWTAHEFKTAGEAFRRVRMLIESTSDLDHRVLRISESHGQEGIELKPRPALIMGAGASMVRRPVKPRLLFMARTSGSGRGFTGDLLIYDEAMILDSGPVGASLPTLSARQDMTRGGPQVWYTGSAGIKKHGRMVSTQLARVRRRGIRGGPDAAGLALLEWSIDPHTDRCPPGCTQHDDPARPESVAKANPALGYRLTLAGSERERQAMDPETYANERLGVGHYPADDNGWAVIPEQWWTTTMIKDPPRPSRPAFAIDAPPDRGSASIGIAGAHTVPGMSFVELADRRPGMKWVTARAAELDRRWSPCCWVVDKRGAAGSLISDLEDAGLTITVIGATEVGYACGQLYDAAKDRLLVHADDGDVTRALAGAESRPLAGQWAWDRASANVDISPLYAITFALWGHQKNAADTGYDAADSVHFDVTEIARLYSLGAYGPHDIARLYSAGLLDDQGLTGLARAGVPIPASLAHTQGVPR